MIVETVIMTEQLGCAPKEVIAFGIQPQTIESGLELSKTIARVTQKVLDLILAELGAPIKYRFYKLEHISLSVLGKSKKSQRKYRSDIRRQYENKIY